MTSINPDDKSKMRTLLKKDIMNGRKVCKVVGEGEPLFGEVKAVYEIFTNAVSATAFNSENVYEVEYTDGSVAELSRSEVHAQLVFEDDTSGGRLLVPSQERALKALQRMPQVLEVLLGSWILCSGDIFKMQKPFTMEEFELGLVYPENNPLMAGLHTRLLVTNKNELKALSQQEKSSDGTQIGFNRPYEWWTKQLYIEVSGWYERRTHIVNLIKRVEDIDAGKQVAGMQGESETESQTDQVEEEDEEDVRLTREAEVLTDDDIEMLLNEQQLWDDFLLRLDSDECPVPAPEMYRDLSPKMRLLLLRALLEFRVLSEEGPVHECFMGFEEDTLRQYPLGTDSKGRRYYYFAQFFRDCRIYREQPAGFSKVYGKQDSDTESEDESSHNNKEQESKTGQDPETTTHTATAASSISNTNGTDSTTDDVKSQEPDQKPTDAKTETEEPKDEAESKDSITELDAKVAAELAKEEQRTRGGRVRISRRAKTEAIEKVRLLENQAEIARKRATEEKKKKEKERELQRKKKAEAKAKADAAKKSKNSKKRKGGGSHNRSVGLYDGVEPEPEKWKLVLTDMQGLTDLITKLAGERKPANADLLHELRDLQRHMQDQAESIQREKERVEKALLLEAIPKKRSSRIASGRMKKLEEESLQLQQQQEEEKREEERRERKRQLKLQREEQQRKLEIQLAEEKRIAQEKRQADMIEMRRKRAELRQGLISQAEYDAFEGNNASKPIADKNVKRVKLCMDSTVVAEVQVKLKDDDDNASSTGNESESSHDADEVPVKDDSNRTADASKLSNGKHVNLVTDQSQPALASDQVTSNLNVPNSKQNGVLHQEGTGVHGISPTTSVMGHNAMMQSSTQALLNASRAATFVPSGLQTGQSGFTAAQVPVGSMSIPSLGAQAQLPLLSQQAQQAMLAQQQAILAQLNAKNSSIASANLPNASSFVSAPYGVQPNTAMQLNHTTPQTQFLQGSHTPQHLQGLDSLSSAAQSFSSVNVDESTKGQIQGFPNQGGVPTMPEDGKM